MPIRNMPTNEEIRQHIENKTPLARLAEDQPQHYQPEPKPRLLAVGTSVFHDSETDVELIMATDGRTITIRVGRDRLELSAEEWRGLYSAVLNIGPGKP
jgi:hypothetical protein